MFSLISNPEFIKTHLNFSPAILLSQIIESYTLPSYTALFIRVLPEHEITVASDTNFPTEGRIVASTSKKLHPWLWERRNMNQLYMGLMAMIMRLWGFLKIGVDEGQRKERGREGGRMRKIRSPFPFPIRALLCLGLIQASTKQYIIILFTWASFVLAISFYLSFGPNYFIYIYICYYSSLNATNTN